MGDQKVTLKKLVIESYRGWFFSSSHDPQVPQLLSGVGGVTLSKDAWWVVGGVFVGDCDLDVNGA